MLNGKNIVARTLLITLAVFINGCALMAAPEPDTATQSLALQRWSHCIERFSNRLSSSSTGSYHAIKAHCDGHQRDVVATFPGYLENQVETLLSQRVSAMTSSRFVKTEGFEAWVDPQGRHLDTFKTRLNEARQGDL